jgi:hypothetical protein
MIDSELRSIIVSKNEKAVKEVKMIDYYLKTNDYKHAARKFRTVGKLMLADGQYRMALHFFRCAAKCNEDYGLYERAVKDRMYAIETLKLLDDQSGIADEYGKIAGIFKLKLGENIPAASYYALSAHYHETTGNYFEAQYLARAAFNCTTKNISQQIAMLHVAVRNAIKANIHEKTIIYVNQLLELISDKKNSSEYDALCRQGLQASINTGDDFYTAYFLKLIIESSASEHTTTELQMLVYDYVAATIRHERSLNDINDALIMNIFQDRLKRSKIYFDLSVVAHDSGLLNLQNDLQIKSFGTKKDYFFYSKSWIKWVGYKLWEITSLYGESIGRWGFVTLITIVLFAVIYSNILVNDTLPSIVNHMLDTRFAVSPDNNIFTPLYFSVVTFVNLGLGDIYPENLSAQVWVVLQSIAGYIMLGVFLSIMSKKIVK